MSDNDAMDTGANPFTSLLAPKQPSGVSVESSFGEVDMTSEMGETVYSLEQLATYDTNGLRALRDRADVLLAKRDSCVLESTTELREMLDTLDKAMVADQRLDLFDLPRVRNYVKAVMITLSKMPEFTGILLDSDVHNILKFAQDTYSATVLAAGASAEKAVRNQKATAAKKELDAKKKGKIALVFNSLDGGF